MATKYPETITIKGTPHPARLTATRIVVKAPGDHSRLRRYELETAFDEKYGRLNKVGRGYSGFPDGVLLSSVSGSPAVQERLAEWQTAIKLTRWRACFDRWMRDAAADLSGDCGRAGKALHAAALVDPANGGHGAVFAAATRVRELNALTWLDRADPAGAKALLWNCPEGVHPGKVKWCHQVAHQG